MSFLIVKTDGTVLTTIEDGELNTNSTPLSLPGRNYPGYGSIVDTNFVHQLENFAYTSPPANALRGQLWFDTSPSTLGLYVCPTDGESNANNWIKLFSSTDLNLDIIANSATLTGDIVANNASIANTVTANLVDTDYLTVNTQANIGNANVTGLTELAELQTSNITTGSNVTAGNLTGAWSIDGTLDVNGNISPAGIKTNNYYYSNGSAINFDAAAGNASYIQYNSGGSLAASPDFIFTQANSTVEVTGTIRTVDVIASGLYTGNGGGLSNIPAANLVGVIPTSIQSNITQLGTLSTLVVTGNIGVGNINAVTSISAPVIAGSLSTASQPNITSVGTLSSLSVTANIAAGNVSATDISGTTLGGTLTTAAQPNITSVGTLSSLTVAANVVSGNVYANSGTIGASLLTGTLTTSAQPNITSVGTLTGATVSGNVTAGNVYANSGTIGASLLTGTLTTAAQPNITSVGTLTSLNVTGNASAGNISATNAITATGNVTGGNVITSGLVIASRLQSNVSTGTAPFIVSSTTRVSNLNVANAGYADTAGTVTTAAQPNITSVGTLTSLDVSGQLVASSNVTTGGYFIGDGSQISNINPNNISGLSASANYASYAGNVTISAQPNITSVGTLISLSVTGNIGAGNVSANFFGSGSGLNSLTGANVIGKVANATFADNAGNAANSNYANSAGYANNAGNANYATTAGTAATASYATQAGSLSGNSIVAISRGGTGSGNVTGAGQNLGIIGVGQTWQSVTGSRSLGTTYTNTTGRPIMVYVRASFGLGFNTNMTAEVNGVEVGFFNAHSDAATVSFLVPANNTYSVTVLPSQYVTLVQWTELR